MWFVIAFMLTTALVFNAPLLIAARLARTRLHPLVPKVTLALGFAAAAVYRLWQMEWFDVWRHGVPPLADIVLSYVPWIAALGVTGWFTGGLLLYEKPLRRGRASTFGGRAPGPYPR